jgi:hypothetical protein
MIRSLNLKRGRSCEGDELGVVNDLRDEHYIQTRSVLAAIQREPEPQLSWTREVVVIAASTGALKS